VCDTPPENPPTIEPELGGELVEPASYTTRGGRIELQLLETVAQEPAGVELPLTDERLGIDGQPSALRAQHVAAVEVLVEHDGFALCGADVAEELDDPLDQRRSTAVRVFLGETLKLHTRVAALDEQRASLRIVFQQADGSVTVPARQRVGLVPPPIEATRKPHSSRPPAASQADSSIAAEGLPG
jgi:hypothetical protein